ncbi:P-loop containing nucleoside triphosphate hydrolase protein, partial [Rozella allomycis CSF55]
MIFLDCLNDSEFKQKALNKLSENYQLDFKNDFEYKDNQFGINPFYINLGPLEIFNSSLNDKFNLNAPTTKNNLIRILRAMQLDKSILMEGNPGVGKTSLISALSAITGHNLVRINLSDQTDIMDLFGSDLPCESGSGTFKWKDGPFLRALKDGHWILLDELNLASQSVLEGLNACLDHRGTVYIPELNKEFKVSKNCRIFAAQNPSCQGGGRKGLPKSFLNRFTQV